MFILRHICRKTKIKCKRMLTKSENCRIQIKYFHLLLYKTIIFTTRTSINMNSNSVASGRANNNDCPAIARTCPTECYSISSTGCIVCQCPQSHGKITGISSHSFVNQIEPNPHLSFICYNILL